MKRVLIITDRLNFACGVSTHIYHLLKNYNRKKIKLYLLGAPGDRMQDFQELDTDIFISKSISYEKKGVLNILFSLIIITFISLRYKIDIVHSQNYYVANVSRIIQKILKFKTIQTQHNVSPRGKLPQYNSNHYILVNDDIKQIAMNQHGINENLISVVRCGIPIPTKQILIDDTPIKVIVVTRLVKEKGVDIFVRAVSLLSQETRGKCEFIVAGEGVEFDNLVKMNKNLGTGIKFIGRVKNTQDLFSSSHIFVMPTRWSMEGFPLTIVEASFNKNFIITSNFRGLNSYFKDKENGFIFEVNDYFQLKSYLEEAINNYSLYDEIRINTYNKFLQLFNLEESIEKTLTIYNKL